MPNTPDILIVSSAFVPSVLGVKDVDPNLDPCIPPEGGWGHPTSNAADTLAAWSWNAGFPETTTQSVIDHCKLAIGDPTTAESLAVAEEAIAAESSDEEVQWRSLARATAYRWLGAHPEIVIDVVHSRDALELFPGWNS